MTPMASMLARVGRNASARSLSALPEAATALPAAAAASRAVLSGNAGGVPILDGRSVASKRQPFGWAHPEGRRLLSTHSSPPSASLLGGVDSVAGVEDEDEYNCPGIMKLYDKDLESEEALWDLYNRWCDYFKVQRSHEEMIFRFNKFKATVRSVHANKDSIRIGLNSLADRSVDEFIPKRPVVTYETYVLGRALRGCIITSEDED